MKSIAGERTGGSKYGVLPGPAELEKMRGRGMTQKEIAEEVEKNTGFRVTRNAVTMALKRAGLSGEVHRYTDLIPWRVRDRHARHYALAMLRAEARQRRGLPMSDVLAGRLDSWKRRLNSYGLVVMYEPESEAGFYLVPRQDGDDLIRQSE